MVQLDPVFLEKKWYAVHTRSHHESKVADLVAAKGIETFLPLRTLQRRWKDRNKLIDFPLFPGYVFVKMPLLEKNKVVQTPSVVRLVGSHRPESMPEEQVMAVRRFLQEEIAFDPYPYLHPGQEVEVIRGPLKGIRGILVDRKGRYRLIVNLPLINSMVDAEIAVEDVAVV